MTTIEETRRELFESKYPLLAGIYWCEDTKQYAGNPLFWLYCDRLEAFNAALDAVVIELPSPAHDYSYSDRDVDGAYEYYRRALSAITSTNLGLRIK